MQIILTGITKISLDWTNSGAVGVLSPIDLPILP